MIFFSSNNTNVRHIATWESDLLAEYVHNLHTCEFDKVPPEALSHPFSHENKRDLELCIDRKNKDGYATSHECKYHIKDECGESVENSFTNNCPQHIAYYNHQANISWTDLPVGFTSTKPLNMTQKYKKFAAHSECLKKFQLYGRQCSSVLDKMCRRKLHVSKLLKLPMDSVDRVMDRLPGAYLIYYVRDPRAIVTSRVNAPMTITGTVEESRLLCQKMRHDFRIFNEVKNLYPGSMILVRYEDYILDVQKTVNNMYGHFNEKPPLAVYQGLEKLMHSNVTGDAYHQTRQNATASLYKWTKSHSKEVINAMTENCKDVLVAHGYPLHGGHY